MNDPELWDYYYIHGHPPHKDENEPDDLPLMTPGEQVAAVVIGVLVACVSLGALVAQIGLFK